MSSEAPTYETQVADDVALGLGAIFDPEDSPEVTQSVDTPNCYRWKYQGRHGKMFRKLAPFKVDGVVDADVVLVRGITFVHKAEDGTLLFERHVDWNDVVAQLGVSRGRASRYRYTVA